MGAGGESAMVENLCSGVLSGYFGDHKERPGVIMPVCDKMVSMSLSSSPGSVGGNQESELCSSISHKGSCTHCTLVCLHAERRRWEGEEERTEEVGEGVACAQNRGN